MQKEAEEKYEGGWGEDEDSLFPNRLQGPAILWVRS